MDDVLSLSATRQAALIRDRRISSRELMQAQLERIAQVNPAINAAVEVFQDRALREAAVADEMLARGGEVGPLHGVGFSVKDSIEIAGARCTAGTVGRRMAAPAADDAALVSRLRQAGAIPIARTNLPDLLFAFESDNLLFGRTNNPYDLSRTAGGSSGGEAALIAACGSALGLGSDAAGSVRLPAAFCGIAAIKPTSGCLCRRGHVPPPSGWIERLWQIGPMARRVEDLRLILPLLGARPIPATAPLRLAFYVDNGLATVSPELARVVRAAAAALEAEEDRPACLAQAYDLEMKLLGADGGDSLWSYLRDIGSHEVHPLLRGWLEKLPPYRTDLRGFQEYWNEWDRYRAEMATFAERYDAIVCPAYTQAALPHGTSTLDENFTGFSYTMAYNVAGWPAAVVRCGETESGLPIAVQIAAAPWREDIVLAVAQRLEDIFSGWRAPRLSGSQFPSPHRS